MSSVIVSCEPTQPPSVVNETDLTIDVFLEGQDDDGTDQLVFTLAPGLSAQVSQELTGDCTSHSLYALDETGNEVERRPPDLCIGDNWFVNGDPSD